MAADLILLNASPLDDVAYAKLLEGTMLRGMWISKADIDKELEKIAAAQRK